MKNFVQPGDTITVAAPSGGVVSGAGVLVGSLFGVAAYSAAEGEPVELKTTGVFDLDKNAGFNLAVGNPVYWDASAHQADETGTNASDRIGVAVATAASDAITARVRLDGVIT